MTAYYLRSTGERVIVTGAHHGLVRYQCADGSVGEIDIRTFEEFFSCVHTQ